MREIEFRAKRVDNNEWFYGVPIFDNGCYMASMSFECDEYACTGVIGSKVIPETVGQYTGLTDKNGRKIFEGDILQYDNVKGVVEYDCNYCLFRFSWKRYDIYRPQVGTNKCALGEFADLKNLEVIGNIYDNEELLEKFNKTP